MLPDPLEPPAIQVRVIETPLSTRDAVSARKTAPVAEAESHRHVRTTNADSSPARLLIHQDFGGPKVGMGPIPAVRLAPKLTFDTAFEPGHETVSA